MVGALKRELELQQSYLNKETVSTVYFGGGTPSLLEAVDIESIVFTIAKWFSLSKQAELTLEANPDDLTPSYLKDLYGMGINRLSIGIQSFNQRVLTWMNRAHTSEQAINSIAWAKKTGFKNINIDLIYGVPLPDYNLEQELSSILSIMPEHISAYNLTIEPKTVFGHQLKQGLLNTVSEDEAADSYQIVMGRLTSAHYLHYETSNFSLPGKQSKHNLGYWKGQPYLGIGPSAHSFNGSSRQFNITNNGLYIKALKDGQVPFSIEHLSPEQRINEMIMLGLRTSEGVDLELSAGPLLWNLQQQNIKYLHTLLDKEFARIAENKLILTDKGKLIADKIAEDLFVGTGE
jgi:oxygen-independent coproporphyrinogen-3 oxidase